MSDSMLAFVKKEKLPTPEALMRKAAAMGLQLEEPEVKQLVDMSGYWPGTLHGVEAGFELFIAKNDPEDLKAWGIEPESLEGRDYCIELAFYTEEDVEACVIAIVVFCKLSDAITFDEEDRLRVNAQNVIRWARDEMGYEI